MKRAYPDRDPGVFRPWIAQDGALVRLRLVGGRLPATALHRLAMVAAELPDCRVHLTSRGNVQLRGLPHVGGRLPQHLVEQLTWTGLVPSTTHDLVRNIIVSPFTGRLGGRADLRDVASTLDRALCADPDLAGLPGLFWFSLDDGSGDVAHRGLDVGLVALDASTAQLRVGTRLWDQVLDLRDAPARMLELARRFQLVRGSGNTALWHVDDLPGKGEEILERPHERHERGRLPLADPPPHGRLQQHDGRAALHLEVPDAALEPSAAVRLSALTETLVVTPWRGLVVPDLPLHSAALACSS